MEILARGKIIAVYDEKAYVSTSGVRMMKKGYVIQTPNERLYFSTIYNPVTDRDVFYKDSYVTVVLELSSSLYANKYYTNLRLKYCIQDGRPPKVVNKEPQLKAMKKRQTNNEHVEDVKSDDNAPVTSNNLPF